MKKTWKKIGGTTLLKTKKIGHDIIKNKLKFVSECYTNVTFMGKTLKLKGFVMNRIQNQFGMDWIELFDLFNQSINSFNYIVSVKSNRIEKKFRLKTKFPEFLLRVLGGV